jgi:uncharacterized membrane protein YccC
VGRRYPIPRTAIALWRDLTRFDAHKMNRWMALRNALGVALPIAIAMDLHSPSSGLVAGIGALNVAAADGVDGYRRRAIRMLVLAFCGAAAVFIAASSAKYGWAAVVVAAFWAFGSGMLVALGPSAANLGTISLVTVVIYNTRPMVFEQAATSGVIALGGGLLQTALSVLLWPLRRFQHEREVLADFYQELARVARSTSPASYDAPFASEQSTAAHESLATLARDHRVEAERYTLLLSQAERIRLSIFALRRFRERMRREPGGSAPVETLDRCRELAAAAMQSVSDTLRTGHWALPAGNLDDFQKAVRAFAAQDRDNTGGPLSSALHEARLQLDALGGQLRAALDLTGGSTAAGEAAFATREARLPWRLRFGGPLAILRANLSLESAAFRHAIRLALCIALAEAAARVVQFERSYWLPMTLAIVLKPDFSGTFSRGLHRLAGTFAGLLLATLLFHFVSPTGASDVLWIGILAFLLRWIGLANYAIFVTALSALIVFLFSLVGIAPNSVIAARAINTTIGGAVALAVYWAWPTWERRQVPQMMANLLDAYRAYFRSVSEAYVRAETAAPPDLDSLRQNARLARSNMEASLDRLSAEPRVERSQMQLGQGLLSSSHRYVHAVMSLEAGLERSHPEPARDAFLTFSNHVDLTLYLQGAVLRGSQVEPSAFPDLRADHNQLAGAGDALNERYALVNIETDRMTNSLNTLTNQVFLWMGIASASEAPASGDHASK